MTEQKCKRCGHEWDYKGKSEYYTTCPKCKTSINVRKKEGGKNGDRTKAN